MTYHWLLTGAAVLLALAAFAKARRLAKRLDRLTEHTSGAVARYKELSSSALRDAKSGIAGQAPDPDTLILDEPVNGLDPEGIRWIRNLLRNLADEGRTIFVSSHLMSEMSLMADQLIVVGRGRLIADMTVEAFIRQASSDSKEPALLPSATRRKSNWVPANRLSRPV